MAYLRPLKQRSSTGEKFRGCTFRAVASDGRFLHFYCDRLTDDINMAWRGSVAQFNHVIDNLWKGDEVLSLRHIKLDGKDDL